MIATPADHQRRPLGNWQSDNAIDIAVAAGTPVLAVADATVVNTGGSAPTHCSNAIGGFNVTLRAAGNEVFYTHMTRALVHPGERVRAGQRIGLSGYANNVEHLHVGLEHGDPLAVWGDGATGARARPATVAARRESRAVRPSSTRPSPSTRRAASPRCRRGRWRPATRASRSTRGSCPTRCGSCAATGCA